MDLSDLDSTRKSTDVTVAPQTSRPPTEAPVPPKIRLSSVVPDDSEFKWNDRDIVLREQRETAIYWNPNGDLVIRQRADWNETDDPFLVIGANNVFEFIDKLCDVAGIPSAGTRS